MKLTFCISLFSLSLFAAPFEGMAPVDYTAGEDYHIVFTQLSATYVCPAESGVSGAFVLCKWPYLYISCAKWGIMVWDISDPTAPVMRGHCNSDGTEPLLQVGIGDFDIYQDTLLVGTMGGFILIINVADPYHPFLLSSHRDFPGHTFQTLVRGENVYTAWYEYNPEPLGFSGLSVYIIADPTYPILADTVVVPGNQPAAFWLNGDYAYLFDTYSTTCGIYVVNIENPFDLEYINFFSPGGLIWGGVAYDNYLTTFGDMGYSFNVTNPLSPVEITTFGYAPCYSVTFDYPYACIAAGAGFALVDVSIPESTHIAGWVNDGSSDAWVDAERRLVYANTPNYLYIYEFTDTTSITEYSNPNIPFLNVYPNPFNSFCHIDAPSGSDIIIYDMAGKIIRHFVSNKAMWNGKDDEGKDTPSGVYLVKAKFSTQPNSELNRNKKMIPIRTIMKLK
jgi:hypothetical protein